MGAEQSYIYYPLNPSPDAICATEAKFCRPDTVRLRIRKKLFSSSKDDFKISDPATGVVYFQCLGKMYRVWDKKILCDSVGKPVLNLNHQVRVYAGDESKRKICKFSSQPTFLKSKLTAHFTDALSGQRRNIVLKGDWRGKRCVIFLGEPKQGGIPIAKIYRQQPGGIYQLGVDDYIIEIAARVDIALMVIMCAPLDEHHRRTSMSSIELPYLIECLPCCIST